MRFSYLDCALRLKVVLCIVTVGFLSACAAHRIPSVSSPSTAIKAHTSQLTLGVERERRDLCQDYNRRGKPFASEQEVVDALRKRGSFKQVDFLDRLSSAPDIVMKDSYFGTFHHFYEPMIQTLTLWVIPLVGSTPYVSEFELTDKRGNLICDVNHKREDTFVAGWVAFPMMLSPHWSAKEVNRKVVIDRFAADVEEAAGKYSPKEH